MRITPSGARGELIGPDGKYRASMTLRAAFALAAELNQHDTRVGKEVSP